MAFKYLRLIRNTIIIRKKLLSTSVSASTLLEKETEIYKVNKFKTENNLVYLGDPDTFGTLSGKFKTETEDLQDDDDIKEDQYLSKMPVQTQKLTIKQYADLIKQYIKHKRIKEAIDVLEVRMLTEDKVKPENYIYNILIGACADVGYTKKAFKLYNDMKRRALQATGDTYTCLFHACANSPWQKDGLKYATNLRQLMLEKGIEPNLTNYNSMIKAFGRCGDLSTTFRIVDEMISKKIKIRVHTFNHLLHACIADKQKGLRHALIVWRKMLKAREKPNIYSFNLMLKCVKECDIGTKEDIEYIIKYIYTHEVISNVNLNANVKPLQIDSNLPQIETINTNHVSERLQSDELEMSHNYNLESYHSQTVTVNGINKVDQRIKNYENKLDIDSNITIQENKLAITKSNAPVIQLVENKKPVKSDNRRVPNLLSKTLQMDRVLSLQEVVKPQDKFTIIGGQEDFLKEMECYSVKPDIKTFTQMLPLLEQSTDAENTLMETMKENEIKADIDFYNMLIKKRCLRLDYESAFAVRDIIDKENKLRKKKHPLKKKLRLKPNIMTYGVLAMACSTKETAEKLLNEMRENQLKFNIEILGTFLKNATIRNNFDYVLYIINVVKEENLNVNDVFIKHLEAFVNKCESLLKQKKNEREFMESFKDSYKQFLHTYNKWLKNINVDEVLTSEHPWKQFREPYPETVQRQHIEIKEPKRFYKRNRKFVLYKP